MSFRQWMGLTDVQRAEGMKGIEMQMPFEKAIRGVRYLPPSGNITKPTFATVYAHPHL